MLKNWGWWVGGGGLQDFSVSPRPLWVFELIVTWLELVLCFGTKGLGPGLDKSLQMCRLYRLRTIENKVIPGQCDVQRLDPLLQCQSTCFRIKMNPQPQDNHELLKGNKVVFGTCNHFFTQYRKYRFWDCQVWKYNLWWDTNFISLCYKCYQENCGRQRSTII